MDRSRSIAAVAIALLGGCDLAFDIDLEPKPCELASFADAPAVTHAPADDFSVDWEMSFAVIISQGLTYELDLTTNTQTPIDLGPYVPRGFSLAPEGSSMFYTASAEPALLKGALRPSAAEWLLDAGVPKGTYAGTPSADIYGPRRLLLKEREESTDIIELEDVEGRWTPIGEPHPIATIQAPNLTPNGLTMVWPGYNEANEPVVFAAQRPSISEWFGEPTVIRTGHTARAQLLGECKRLYVIDPPTQSEPDALRHYDL